jgi:hypothetical protein
LQLILINKFFRVIGHFTAMITARTTKVGCGISSYTGVSGGYTWNYYLMACNYASTNFINFPVYKSTSGKAGDGCIKGTDPNYPGLCVADEPIDPNDVWGSQ